MLAHLKWPDRLTRVRQVRDMKKLHLIASVLLLELCPCVTPCLYVGVLVCGSVKPNAEGIERALAVLDAHAQYGRVERYPYTPDAVKAAQIQTPWVNTTMDHQ